MQKYFIFLLNLIIVSSNAWSETQARLGSYNIDTKAITISGLSSGAYMAVQMGVAYSRTFSGVSSFGGGIYGCARGDVHRAQILCMAEPEAIDVRAHLEEIDELARRGDIDPIENIRHQKLFIFQGLKDTRVLPANADKLNEFYRHLAPFTPTRVEKLAAEHGLPTLNFGNPCDVLGSPFMLACRYDGAGQALNTMYGSLAARQSAVDSHLLAFSQREFDQGKATLFAKGWLYVPEACARGEKCKLHVALHGCKMNPSFIEDQFVRHAGFNEWAESNQIIVLYPQAARLALENPFGCWDWFGYTGPGYITRSGPQMAALKAMVDRLAGNQNRSRN